MAMPSWNSSADQGALAQRAEEASYQRVRAHILETHDCSVSSVVTNCRVSYNGAIAFLERLERDGIVSPADIQGARRVLEPPTV